MANILNIETSGKRASIALASDDQVIASAVNDHFPDHAAWLHPAVERLIKDAGLAMNRLDAVAVSEGPGSYTGLRLGMATAKGLCYALQIPLIAIPTLELMAHAASKETAAEFYCPMIDARRLEVYTAVYDKELNEQWPATALVLDGKYPSQWMEKGLVQICGDGAAKAKNLIRHTNVRFSDKMALATDMTIISSEKYRLKQWSDLAYTEPFYLKEFFTPGK